MCIYLKWIEIIFVLIVLLYPCCSRYIINIKTKCRVKKMLGVIVTITEFCMVYYFINSYEFSRMIMDMILQKIIFYMSIGIFVGLSFFIVRNMSIIMRIKLNGLKVGTIFRRVELYKEIITNFYTSAIEEIIWRGVLQRALGYNLKSALIISIIFVISHIKRRMRYWDMIELFLLSFVLGIIMLRTNSIIYCYLFHVSRNLFVIFIRYFVKGNNDGL